MRKPFVSGLIGLLPLGAMAQQMDMEAMTKWGAADVVRYHMEEAYGGAVYLKSKTIYPVVEVAQSCTASRKAVPAKVTEETEDFGIPSPIMFGMPLPQSDDLAVTPDKKSFIVKKAGWTWTLTPSIAR